MVCLTLFTNRISPIFFLQFCLIGLSVGLSANPKRQICCGKITEFLNLGLFFWLVSKVKLVTNGEYSAKHGLHYAELLTRSPRSPFKVDEAPPNFTELRPTFTEDEVAFLSPFVSPAFLCYLTNFCFFFAFLVVIVATFEGTISNLIQLIRANLPSRKCVAEISKRQKPSSIC